MFEIVISTVDVLKRPPLSSKRHATLFSGASTPNFSALSVQDKPPECSYEVLKEEPQSFKIAVVEENGLVFEQADVFVDDMSSCDDIVISEVMSHSVKQNKIAEQGWTSSSVQRSLDNSSITTHLCSSSADSLVMPDSSRVDNFVEVLSCLLV